MLCSRPYVKTPTGVTPLTFINKDNRMAATPFACGQCLHCRINKARTWKHRIMLESMNYPDNSFATLTYNDDNLPEDRNLSLPELQKFLKRLRKRLSRKFRYFAVGEYGERSFRPHYHLILFGLSYFVGQDIFDAWNKGHIKCDELSEKRAGYIVGYTTEKLTRKKNVNPLGLRSQFATMSKRDGGIGLPTVLKVADAIKKDPNWNGKPVTEFTYGRNKKLPLGGYLQRRINEELGISEEEMEKLTYERQLDTFQTYVFGEQDPNKVYFDKLIEANTRKRSKQNWRYKNFKRKKQL